MKTSLTLLSLLSALAVPGGFAAALAGFSFPAGLDISHAFVGFVIGFVLLIVREDYLGPRTAPLSGRAGTANKTTSGPKAAHPLAA